MAPVTLATRADEAGGPPPSEPHERGDNLVERPGAENAGGSTESDDTEVTVDRMTEEELLKGLEGLTPPEEQPEEEE